MSSTFALEQYIKEIIVDYEKIIGENKDEKIREKYTHYIEALKRLIKSINVDWEFNDSRLIEDILISNYNQYDTKFYFYGGDDLYLPKDVVTKVDGDFVSILGAEEDFKKQIDLSEVPPVVLESFNIKDIKRIQTIKE